MRSSGTVGAARSFEMQAAFDHTRKGNDWTKEFQGVAQAAQALPARSFCIDGELIGDTDGYDFFTLPTAIRRGQVNVVAF